MAIELNDNIDNKSPKILDKRFSKNDGTTPYVSVAEANSLIPISYRALGLPVLIGNVEYWYRDGIQDIDLIPKKTGLQNPVCELILQKNIIPNNLLPPINFIHTDNGAEIDIITAGVTEFFRGVSQSIYNIAVEGAYNYPTSPQNTEWNSVYTDPINNGHANIQNVTSRVYSDFVTALNLAIGTFILATPLVMHDLITDKYYLFTFTQWTSGGGGGGFSYTRTEVLIGAVICNGRVTFDDGTWIDTKPNSDSLVPTHAAKSPTTTYAPPISTGVNSVLVGLALNDGGGSEVFAFGTRLFLNGAPTLFGVIALGFANTFNAGNYQGIYFIGDGNSFSGGSSFASVFGEQNSITSGTYSVIQGISNTHTNSNSQVTIGLSNTILNSSNSVVIGMSNNQSSLNNSIVIGRNNTSPVNVGSVNILNANFGVKILTTFAGIGTTAFAPSARWHVKGADLLSTSFSLKIENSANNLYRIANNGTHLFNSYFDGASGIPNYQFEGNSGILIKIKSVGGSSILWEETIGTNGALQNTGGYGQIYFKNRFTLKNWAGVSKLWMDDANGYIAIGANYFAATAQCHIQGDGNTLISYAQKIENNLSQSLLSVRNDGFVGIGYLAPLDTERLKVAGRIRCFGIAVSDNAPMLNGFVTIDTGFGVYWTNGSMVQTDSVSGYLRLRSAGNVIELSNQNLIYNLAVFSPNGVELTPDLASAITPITTYTMNLRSSYWNGVVNHNNAYIKNVATDTLGGYKISIWAGASERMSIKNNGQVNISSLPASPVGLVAGDLWNNLGVVNIV